jgi:hypothetical protein
VVGMNKMALFPYYPGILLSQDSGLHLYTDGTPGLLGSLAPDSHRSPPADYRI